LELNRRRERAGLLRSAARSGDVARHRDDEFDTLLRSQHGRCG